MPPKSQDIPVCKFFVGPGGCRNSKCKFAHSAAAAAVAQCTNLKTAMTMMTTDDEDMGSMEHMTRGMAFVVSDPAGGPPKVEKPCGKIFESWKMSACEECGGCCGTCFNFFLEQKQKLRISLAFFTVLQFLVAGLAFITPYQFACAIVAVFAVFGLVSIGCKWRWGMYVYAIFCLVLFVLFWIAFAVILANPDERDEKIAEEIVYVISISIETVCFVLSVIMIIKKDLDNERINKAVETGKSAYQTKKKLDAAGVDSTALLVGAAKASKNINAV